MLKSHLSSPVAIFALEKKHTMQHSRLPNRRQNLKATVMLLVIVNGIQGPEVREHNESLEP